MLPKMADQIPRIKSKGRVLQFKPPHLCFQTLMVFLCVLATSICLVETATWPISVPSSAATTTDQYTFDLYFDDLYHKFMLSSILRNFSGYTSTDMFGVVGNSVSNNLYYMYSLQLKK